MGPCSCEGSEEHVLLFCYSTALPLMRVLSVGGVYQGYNSALTAHAEAPRRRGPDQIKEMKLKLHSAIASVLRRLASDPHTTIIIMSGSERAVLDEVWDAFVRESRSHGYRRKEGMNGHSMCSSTLLPLSCSCCSISLPGPLRHAS